MESIKFLTEEQLDKLTAISEKTGVPVAVIVRSAFDAFNRKPGLKPATCIMSKEQVDHVKRVAVDDYLKKQKKGA